MVEAMIVSAASTWQLSAANILSFGRRACRRFCDSGMAERERTADGPLSARQAATADIGQLPPFPKRILFRESKLAWAASQKGSHLQRLNRPLPDIDGIAQVGNSQTACRHVKGARENLIWMFDFGPHSVRSVS
jgi:hypothetical protein